MIVFAHELAIDYTELKRATFLDFIFENNLHSLESVTLLGAFPQLIIVSLELDTLICSSIHNDFNFVCESFHVLHSVSTKYHHDYYEDDAEKNSDQVCD